MKKDLDSLMQQYEIDAILVIGPAKHNPAMVYLTGGGHITNADLIKKRGDEAVLFHGAMEREEAAKTGLKTRSYNEYPMAQWLKETSGSRLQTKLRFYQAAFTEMGITTGKVMVFGRAEVGPAHSIFSALEQAMTGLSLVGDTEGMVLTQAMATKDADEIERIRRMGKITTEVVGLTADFLTSHKVKDNHLVKTDGSPLKIGDVKQRINLWLAERGAENPEDTIFAIGADAGFPHSSGNPDDIMELGKTIVYDIFPVEAGGGYFYDFTRTWCLGYAPDDVQKLYNDVRTVYDTIMSELKCNAQGADYQRRTCEIFESQGHPTISSQPTTDVGYVHSLGHGVGLNIHEKPNLGALASPENILAPGSVFTVEPGLYYPDRGMGVRLEDTVWVHPDGQIEVFAPYPLDLVLPVKS